MKKEQNHNASETRKKSYILLIIGAVLLAGAVVFAVYAHGSSYAASLETGSELSEVKAMIKSVEAGEAAGDLEALKARQTQLKDLKLSQERPYSYSLTVLFFSLLLMAKGLYNALVGTVKNRENIKRLAMAGLMAALCYIGFAVFKIDIPVGPGKTAFHFGNVFCVLAALLLGGFWGGLAGAIGMTIGDLTTAYVTSAPKTFLLKLCIGLIVGLIAHVIFQLSRTHSRKYITGVTMEALFKVRYWDYSNQRFNFQGHICLSSSIAWGFLTILMTRVVHMPIEQFVMSIPGNLLFPVTMALTVYIVVDFTLSFKAAMEIRDILVKMQRLKEEVERLQRRLDVIIAFNNAEKQQRRQESEQSLAELSVGVRQRFVSLKESIQNMPSAYGEGIREEIAELRGRFSHYIDVQKSCREMLGYYKRDMIRNNPTMVSEKFKNVLEELKRIVSGEQREEEEQE